jgi:uncharacterized protein YvpB
LATSNASVYFLKTPEELRVWKKQSKPSKWFVVQRIQIISDGIKRNISFEDNWEMVKLAHRHRKIKTGHSIAKVSLIIMKMID